MRQLESQISLDQPYWKKNYDKCISAIDIIVELLDVSNGEGVRSAAMCALSQILTVIKILPEKSSLLQTIINLHSDESMNVSSNAQEMLNPLVEKCSLSQCIKVLENCIDPENGMADLGFGHTKLLDRICVEKSEQLSEEGVINQVLPVQVFAPSLLQQFASSYTILRKSASSALVKYKNLVGEESILPFMRESYKNDYRMSRKMFILLKRQQVCLQTSLFTIAEC